MGIAGFTIMPDRAAGYGYYYGNPWYDYQWDPNIWSTGNGYY